jgi:hypothetical protein
VRVGDDTVTISWDARQQLVERLRQIPSAISLMGPFARHGTSSIVIPARYELRLLRDVTWRWMEEVGRHRLPEGIPQLRDALVDGVGPNEAGSIVPRRRGGGDPNADAVASASTARRAPGG